ncbi:(2Fe-2S)-binding protein [Aureimonas mangrovi]|uniref:(2Fe-2S)-binding protein n=1 Tax=Aureimonas mangrovi TaxID=2758041 RepID=UPI00163D6745
MRRETQRSVRFCLNGKERTETVDVERSLLDVLRADFAIKGPKYGCGLAQCGSCTVLVDGAPARSCVLRAAKADGSEIVTLEGLADDERGVLHPVQQGFIDAQGAQCGYCLNGMIMTTVALLRANPAPSDTEIRSALRHNLCRCGTHQEILESVRRAASLTAARQAGGVAT